MNIYATKTVYYTNHTCSAAICPDPPEIDHGSVNITGNCIGDYAHYSCDPGFKLKGDPYLTCEKLSNYTAVFQLNPPVCHRECCMNGLHAFLYKSYQNLESYKLSTLMHLLMGWISVVFNYFLHQHLVPYSPCTYIQLPACWRYCRIHAR